MLLLEAAHRNLGPAKPRTVAVCGGFGPPVLSSTGEDSAMSSKLSVEEVLANLEQRAAFHREQEALHAEQEAHHREQRALHAAELATVLQNLEAFRTAAATAVELARPVAAKAAKATEQELPPSGRLMVGRLLRRIALSPSLAEPFGPSAVAAEANRRFADRLPSPVGTRTASDVLRRMLANGELQLASRGKAFHEATYTRRPRRRG